MAESFLSEIPHLTRQPFELSDELAARVNELGLGPQVAQLRDEGYTIVPDIASREFTARLRDKCLQLAQETEGPLKGKSASQLLGRDPLFEEVVLNPKIQALVEIMCGQGALLSELLASKRPKTPRSMTLHADQNWTPAPFPVHNQLFTMCWTMEDFTQAGGCTKLVPKSHLHRRHPTPEEVEQEPGAIPAECPVSSIVCWDGSTWHGNYPRELDGERVLLHITFSRLALRPVDNYDHLDDEWLEGKPYQLRVMLGREDFLGSSTIALGGPDYSKSPRTFTWAKT